MKNILELGNSCELYRTNIVNPQQHRNSQTMNTQTNTNTNAVRELLEQIKANKASSDKLRELCLSNALGWTQWHKKDQELLEAWGKLAQSLSNASGMRYCGHYPEGVSFEAAQELPEFYESNYKQSEEA